MTDSSASELPATVDAARLRLVAFDQARRRRAARSPATRAAGAGPRGLDGTQGRTALGIDDLSAHPEHGGD
ncbi:MAG: hypothetical protein KIT60_05900 [Burkholderiaceae bacterium]|nr:hypothetical protein [Burkholderiaceae bacterium]